MNKYWFRPKAIGWGISRPTSWEGWIVLMLYVLCLIVQIFFTDKRTLNGKLLAILEVFITSCIFLFAVRKRVEGGLKWRSIKDRNNFKD